MFWVIKMQPKYMFSWNKKGKIKIHSTSVYVFSHYTIGFLFPFAVFYLEITVTMETVTTHTSAAQHEYILLGNTGDNCHDYFIEVLSPMYSFGFLNASGQNGTT